MQMQTKAAAFLRSLSKPEQLTVAILAIFGTAVVFMTPVGAGYDEETHLARVWEMSALQLIPNERLGSELPFPAVYFELSYRRLKIVTARPPEFLGEYAGLRLDAHDYIYGEFETRSVYSPPLLGPQAFVMRYLGRALDQSALAVFYACRLAGLLCYILLAWLAVRWIPFGKWLMAVLAAAPMAMFQASTISTDAISNGIALLFIGACLALATLDELSWKEWGKLAALFFVLFWGKVNLVPLALLPFVLIPPHRFKNRSQYFLLIAAALILFMIEVVGWNVLAYARYPSALEGADPGGQLKHILGHPFGFAWLLLRNFWESMAGYLRGWLALYGYDYWPVPGAVYWLYSLAIIISLWIRAADEKVPARSTRIGLALVFLLSYSATVASLYLSYTPVGSDMILGVQGRYFFPVLPLLLLAVWGLREYALPRRALYMLNALALTGLGLYLVGLVLVYHVSCGAQYYRFDLCFQPNYKNFAPEARYSEPITSAVTLKQEIVPRCNGLTELRVWVSAREADASQPTAFILTEAGSGEELANSLAGEDRLPPEGWYTLAFAPQSDSNGKLYLLTIKHSGAAAGPRISYSLRPEYLDGKLYENEQNVAQDIVFQYGCSTGLNKLLFRSEP